MHVVPTLQGYNSGSFSELALTESPSAELLEQGEGMSPELAVVPAKYPIPGSLLESSEVLCQRTQVCYQTDIPHRMMSKWWHGPSHSKPGPARKLPFRHFRTEAILGPQLLIWII
ncbi:putative inactive neutral ceramidase B [Manis javanica]|nr:putative inactive neutral ceramidase B [Manis javanica]